MNMLEFLQSVWPDEGNYCLAVQVKWTDDNGKECSGYRHYVRTDIQQVVQQAKLLRQTVDVYFCIHTLKENLKKGKREQTNMARARCLFLDLDVGTGGHKFASRVEAVSELQAFCKTIGFPEPTLVGSGGGVHVYWPFTRDISTKRWLYSATLLYRLVIHHGFKADRARIKDQSSVLRIPNTLNFKQTAPRPVVVKHVGVATEPDELYQALYDACEEAGISTDIDASFTVTAGDTGGDTGGLGSNTTMEFSGQVPSFDQVAEVCGQFRHFAEVGGGITYNYWHKLIAAVRKCSDGVEKCHELSAKDYPEYDAAYVDKKLADQDKHHVGPTTCNVLNDQSGNDICGKCPLWGVCSSPVRAPYVPQITNEPPPAMQLSMGGDDELTVEPPELPEAYAWTKQGVAIRMEKGEKTFWQNVLQYKLFPVTRQTDSNGRNDQHVWCAYVPNEKPKMVVFASGVIYDLNKLVQALADLSIYIDAANIKLVQTFMVAYIRKLQRDTAPEAQHTHMGWIDNYQAFALGHTKIMRDGSKRPVQYGGNTAGFAEILRLGKAGTIEEQISAMEFYNRPEYLPQQFYIGAALGSLFMHMTGQHGAIVHASGLSGGGKSAMLMAAMGFFGDPRANYLNATKDVGATPKARSECMFALHSLPFGVDELSGLLPEGARSFAYEVSQPRARLGLQANRSLIKPTGSSGEANDTKANLILSTGNGSLHALLAEGSQVGDATSMRVIELNIPPATSNRLQAEIMMQTLAENYGHIGEAVIIYTMEQYDWAKQTLTQLVANAEKKYNLKVSERFWTISVCCTVLGLRIAKHLGLLSFEPNAVRDYAFNIMLPRMRGILVEEYISPAAALNDCIGEVVHGTVLVDEGKNVLVDLKLPTHQSVKARLEKHKNLLYLATDAFHRFCQRGKYPRRDFVDALIEQGVILRMTRKSLAEGSYLEGGRVNTYVVNMDHEAVAKRSEEITTAVTNATTGTTAPRLLAHDLKVIGGTDMTKTGTDK